MTKRIAYVDDIRASGFLTALRGAGFDVHHIEDADDAATIIGRDPNYDCVVLDVRMPAPKSVAAHVAAHDLQHGENTGIWILQQIESAALKRNIPVLLLTAKPQREIEQLVTDFGIEMKAPMLRIESRSATSGADLPNIVRSLLALT